MEFVEKKSDISDKPAQFKMLHLLQCDFETADETTIKHQVKFRNKVAKVELEQMQARLKQVCGTIEDLNPSLVQQICKALQFRKPSQQLDYKEI
jgi:hypothetical protein